MKEITAAINRKIAPPLKDAVDFDLRLKPYEYFTLHNGTRVYAVDAGTEEVLQLEFVFYAGNSYEEKNLVASSANFLLKNGTSSKTAFEINEHFDFYGSYLNRQSFNETATVTLHCLTKHLGELLPVIAEMFTDSVFPEQELETYRQNMKQRLEVNLRKCDVVAERLIDEYLYGAEHPYGKNSSIKAYNELDRDSIRAFYEQYYKHGRCIIFVAGILPKDLQPMLDRHFGQLPLSRSPLTEKGKSADRSKEKKFRISNDPNGVQGAIRIARPFPNRHHPDFQKVQVLNTVFGGFFGSRLMSNIREDKGYTYGIFSYLQNHMKETAWVVSTEVGNTVTEAAVKEIYHEMKMLREGFVPEEELHLVKNFLMGTILGDLDGPFHIIGRWKNIILNDLDEKYFYNFIDTIRTITSKELNELAQKYLVEDEFYELVVI